MRNNAHSGETQEHRLERFRNNPPVEAILTLLNSIANYFNNEIKLTPDAGQTTLLFLGIHASVLTISETFFGSGGVKSYKRFLEMFIDGTTEGTKFSLIASSIHDWRNNLAHQWLGSIGHEIAYDYEMTNGWETSEGVTYINPRIYCEQYLAAFNGDGRIWNYESLFTADELEQIRNRIIKRYQKTR